MGILAWILLGGIAGWLASMVMKTNGDMGIAWNVVVGIVGALLGGWVASLLGIDGVTGFNLWSLLVATGGACLLLLIVRAVSR